MFGFLKSRKGAAPIFEALGTDMHCHLIPNVDDGSRSELETVECLEILQSVGYKHVIITPHFQAPRFPNQEEDIVARYKRVQDFVADKGLKITLNGIAGEYRIDSGFEHRLNDNKFLTLKYGESNMVLIEFSLRQHVLGIKEIIDELQADGYTVILAHPERYPYLNINGMEIRSLKENGVLLQLNLLSLDGFYGDEPKRKALQLIERGWVEFMGTDMHNPLYGQALILASRNRTIEKIINKYHFLNNELI